jgi:hypothetical protein
MSDVAPLRPHLERRFESHRIVFWHDPRARPLAVANVAGIGKRISV